MPLDSDSLGSLRIDRSTPASDGGAAKPLIYIGVAVVLVAGVGRRSVVLVRRQDHRSHHGGGRSRQHWPESGKFRVERLGLRGGAPHGHGVIEGHRQDPGDPRRRRHDGEEGPGARQSRSGEPADHAHHGGARARSLAPQPRRDRSAPGRCAPHARTQRVAGQAATHQRVGARHLARRSERAGRAARSLQGAGQGGREPARHAPDRLRRPAGARAVRRRRHLQGRAAGRNRLADVGGWRFHAHRHRHHRRHGFARSRGRRQRGLHQSRQDAISASKRRSMPIPTRRWRRMSSTSCPPRIAPRPPCACASASTSSSRRSCPTWASRCASSTMQPVAATCTHRARASACPRWPCSASTAAPSSGW